MTGPLVDSIVLPDEDRYRLVLLRRGEVLQESDYRSLPLIRNAIRTVQKESPNFLKTGDINVVDTKLGTEWTVNQKWELVEM